MTNDLLPVHNWKATILIIVATASLVYFLLQDGRLRTELPKTEEIKAPITAMCVGTKTQILSKQCRVTFRRWMKQSGETFITFELLTPHAQYKGKVESARPVHQLRLKKPQAPVRRNDVV